MFQSFRRFRWSFIQRATAFPSRRTVTGTVTVANDHHTVIEFDEHGPRTFATRLVRLEASATAAPPKPVKTRRRTAKVKS